MSNSNGACSNEQDALLDAFLSEGENAQLSDELSCHLEQCVSCRKYREALAAVKLGFSEAPLYSSALKNRTLRRIADPEPMSGAKWLPLIVPAALLSLSISLLIPGWLLSRLFLRWDSSAMAAYGTGYGIVMLLGTLGTVAVGISLAELGYIRTGDRTQGMEGLCRRSKGAIQPG